MDKQYRLLKKGETILETDQFMRANCIEWSNASRENIAGSSYSPGGHMPVRREIEEPMSFDEWLAQYTDPETDNLEPFTYEDMRSCHEWTINNEKLKKDGE